MTIPHDKALLPCPFCGGEAAIEQTGKNELTLRCVGVQPSGLLGCGPKYVQKAGIRFTLEWLADRMTEKWNSRIPIEAGNGGDGWLPIETAPKDGNAVWLGHESGLMETAYFNRAGNGFWVNRYTGLPVQWKPRFWQRIPSPPSPSNVGEKQP